jgi:hypothetical protein
MIVVSAGAGLDILQDPLTVDSTWVQADSVYLQVSYRGGCREHRFLAYGRPVFQDTDPPTMSVFLHHSADGDDCDAPLTRRLGFDVSRVSDHYRQLYGELDVFGLEFFCRDEAGVAHGSRILYFPGIPSGFHGRS